MKIIDRHGRLFGKISVIDVLVIAVVLVMAAALFFKSNQTHTGTSVTSETITYQMVANGVRTYVADAVQVGDLMYDQDRSSGGTLGKIVDIQVLPGTKLGEMNDGTAGMVPVEDGVDLLLTIEGSGIVSEGRYLLNRVYDLGVNSARNYYTPYAQFTGTITAILEP